MEPLEFLGTPSPRGATTVEVLVKRTSGLLRALGYIGAALGLFPAVLIVSLSDPGKRLGAGVLGLVFAVVIGGPFVLAARIGIGRTRRLWRDGTLVTGLVREAGISLAASMLASGASVYRLSVEFQLGARRFLATTSSAVALPQLRPGDPIPLLVLASAPGKVVLLTGPADSQMLEGSCRSL